jgi:methionyl-tRNA synthetase
MAYGFLHGIEALGRRSGRDWSAAAPSADWKIVHFFGFDNSFYHTILYPVLYHLAFPEWRPNVDYHVNEFLALEREKFSTSRRHAIWGKDILGPETVDAVRLFLARIRPEHQRTNFDRRAFAAFVADDLLGRWEGWLTDLGQRVEDWYGSRAPDAGTWTPEQQAFLGRLNQRLAVLALHLSPGGFSLTGAAAELDGLVSDARSFRERERWLDGSTLWSSERRTAMALELAAAWLLAQCSAPLIPRFAGRLAAALGRPAPSVWPASACLLPPETVIELAGCQFFGPRHDGRRDSGLAHGDGHAPAHPQVTPLHALVQTTLALPEGEDIGGQRLSDLGVSSLQAMTLQYQILEHFDRDVTIEDLLGQLTIRELEQRLTWQEGVDV